MTQEDKIEEILAEIEALKSTLEGFLDHFDCSGCKGPNPTCPVSGTKYCARILVGDTDE